MPYRDRDNKHMFREYWQNLLHVCMFYVQMDGQHLSIENVGVGLFYRS